MRAYLCAALIGAAFTQLSCADLSSIERGSCGNAIVEPEAGEDCDSFPADGCHPPDSKYACRLACDPATLQGCPEGWGCGSEGVCRQPTSTFAPGSRPSPRPAARLFSADFDGDGRRDVASLAPDELRIHYFDDADPFGSVLSVRPAAMPAVGDLTPSDPASDLVFVSSGSYGISVLHGRSDRSLLPLPYSFLSAPDAQLTFVSLEAMPDDLAKMAWIGEEALLIVGKLVTAPGGKDDGGDLALYTLPRDISELAGPLQIAKLWDDPVRSPCDEVALTWKDASDVSVLTPCKCTNCPVPEGTQPQYAWNVGGGALATVTFPAGAKASSAAIATRLDGDAHLDLIVTQGSAVYAAYGLGNGKFASSPDMLTSDPPQSDNKFGKVTLLGSGAPWPASTPINLLAAGQTDGDGYPELVVTTSFGSAVLRSLPDSKPNTWNYAGVTFSSVPWSGARLGDFNLDGRADIVGWSDQARDIHFLSGAEGGYFNEFVLKTDRVPALVRIADLDGDSVDDLVYVDRAPGLDDSLSIMFGRTYGAPEEAVQVARFATIEEVVPTQMPIMALDRVADLIVLTKDAAGKRGISIFQGATNRQVQSPLWLLNEQVPDSAPMLAAVGDFANDANHQLDVISVSAQDTNSDSPQDLPVEHLWLVPMQGDAEVDPNQVIVSQPLPPRFRGEAALMTAVDLDGTATTQELVMLGRMWPPTNANHGALLIARVTEADGKRTLELVGDAQETAEAWAVPDPLLPYASATTDRAVGGQIRAVDVDADGRLDVAAMGQVLEGSSPSNAIAIFPNTGSGTLSATDSVRVPNNTGGLLTGFAFVQADLDPPLELVLLGKEQAWLVQVDLTARSFSEPVLLEAVGGGADALGEDFDRDGIHDLMIVGDDGLRFHKGIAVLP